MRRKGEKGEGKKGEGERILAVTAFGVIAIMLSHNIHMKPSG